MAATLQVCRVSLLYAKLVDSIQGDPSVAALLPLSTMAVDVG